MHFEFDSIFFFHFVTRDLREDSRLTWPMLVSCPRTMHQSVRHARGKHQQVSPKHLFGWVSPAAEELLPPEARITHLPYHSHRHCAGR